MSGLERLAFLGDFEVDKFVGHGPCRLSQIMVLVGPFGVLISDIMGLIVEVTEQYTHSQI